MVLYTPNLVLTSGLLVRTLDAMVLYTPNLLLTSGPWPDGSHTVQWLSTPQTLF